jgi:hypothetical protein
VGDSREHGDERSGCIKCSWFLQLVASERLCSMEFVCPSVCQSLLLNTYMATNIKNRTHYKESEDAETLYQLQTGPTAHVSSTHTQLERCFKVVPVGCHVSHWIVQDWARLGKCLPPFISTFPRCILPDANLYTVAQWIRHASPREDRSPVYCKETILSEETAALNHAHVPPYTCQFSTAEQYKFCFYFFFYHYHYVTLSHILISGLMCHTITYPYQWFNV